MFDPTKPANNSPNSSAEMRGQLTSLKALIDAVQSILAAQVDGVTTLNPGDPAAATVSVIGDTLHFSFSIPKGDDGGAGATGAQGPPFASAIVDGVTTLAPGTPATVSVSFDGTNVHFVFGIPTGDTGGQGIQGIPGEVSNVTLAAAISGTSSNTNAVATLGLTVSDPPTQAEMQSIASKLDELILAARR